MILPTFVDVITAAERIAPHTHRTPVLTSRYLSEATGAEVYLKAENLQKVGAFKARGATNAVLSLSGEDAAKGVITHSSGNHGQAVAYACSIRDIPAVVVMPEHAPRVKVDAVRGYGGSVVFCPQPERAQTVARLTAEHGYTVVHPFDDPAVIAGQATATLEFVDEIPDIDLVLAPIGGGGLLSGASIVASEYDIDVVGAEPELVDDSFRSLRDNVRYPATGAISVGDGLLTGIGEIPFAILSAANRSIVTVTENEILEAMRTLAHRTKLVVEPSGATAVAALLGRAPLFAGKRVGVILSGGNVSLDMFAADQRLHD
ncbi:MAG: pyridoxal-phosphate dependent enzyme [Acidimicrobiia bacterium]|nr:MAG: pyridoxal-phosphate dependent enzyme [Acidimicrobiia bacterium]